MSATAPTPALNAAADLPALHTQAMALAAQAQHLRDRAAQLGAPHAVLMGFEWLTGDAAAVAADLSAYLARQQAGR